MRPGTLTTAVYLAACAAYPFAANADWFEDATSTAGIAFDHVNGATGDFWFPEIMGGGAALHQFCRVGHHAFIGGMAGVEFDVIPYGMALGGRAHLGGLNIIGMKRSGLPRSEIHALRHGVKRLFSTGNGKTLRDNTNDFIAEAETTDSMKDIARFILSDSKRKFITPRDRGVLATDTESDEGA